MLHKKYIRYASFIPGLILLSTCINSQADDVKTIDNQNTCQLSQNSSRQADNFAKNKKIAIPK